MILFLAAVAWWVCVVWFCVMLFAGGKVAFVVLRDRVDRRHNTRRLREVRAGDELEAWFELPAAPEFSPDMRRTR